MYLIKNSDFCSIRHKLFDFITEMECVYCAVRTGSLNKTLPFAVHGLNNLSIMCSELNMAGPRSWPAARHDIATSLE